MNCKIQAEAFMIINNSMYLNYLNTLQNPSNDINTDDEDDTTTSNTTRSDIRLPPIYQI